MKQENYTMCHAGEHIVTSNTQTLIRALEHFVHPNMSQELSDLFYPYVHAHAMLGTEFDLDTFKPIPPHTRRHVLVFVPEDERADGHNEYDTHDGHNTHSEHDTEHVSLNFSRVREALSRASSRGCVFLLLVLSQTALSLSCMRAIDQFCAYAASTYYCEVNAVFLSFDLFISELPRLWTATNYTMDHIFEEYKDVCLRWGFSSAQACGHAILVWPSEATFHLNRHFRAVWIPDVEYVPPAPYIGLYLGSSIRAVGKVISNELMHPSADYSDLMYQAENTGANFDDTVYRLIQVDNFYLTDFRRVRNTPAHSKHTIDLRDYLYPQSIQKTCDLAEFLSGKTW